MIVLCWIVFQTEFTDNLLYIFNHFLNVLIANFIKVNNNGISFWNSPNLSKEVSAVLSSYWHILIQLRVYLRKNQNLTKISACQQNCESVIRQIFSEIQIVMIHRLIRGRLFVKSSLFAKPFVNKPVQLQVHLLTYTTIFLISEVCILSSKIITQRIQWHFLLHLISYYSIL